MDWFPRRFVHGTIQILVNDNLRSGQDKETDVEIDKISSFDETSGKMAQAGKKAEQTKKMANQYQLKAINKEIDGNESLRDKCFEKYNVDSIEKLTYSQAANLIKDLQNDKGTNNSGEEEKDEPTIL